MSEHDARSAVDAFDPKMPEEDVKDKIEWVNFRKRYNLAKNVKIFKSDGNRGNNEWKILHEPLFARGWAYNDDPWSTVFDLFLCKKYGHLFNKADKYSVQLYDF